MLIYHVLDPKEVKTKTIFTQQKNGKITQHKIIIPSKRFMYYIANHPKITIGSSLVKEPCHHSPKENYKNNTSTYLRVILMMIDDFTCNKP